MYQRFLVFFSSGQNVSTWFEGLDAADLKQAIADRTLVDVKQVWAYADDGKMYLIA